MKGQYLPTQSAPVTRYVSPAAVSEGSGVEASGIWDDIKNAASTVISSPITHSLVKAGLGALGI